MPKLYRKPVSWRHKSIVRSVLTYFRKDRKPFSLFSIKSDAINALRKKYEAFLEQDKKRKERNEYILGILDKMRSCTSVVPLKSNPPRDGPVLPKSFIPTQETLPNQGAIYPRRSRDLAVNVPSRITAENSIITELLNKYILIPKLNYEDNPTYDKPFELQTNIQDTNTDWKSKYEILNQLKQKEKEELEPEKDIPGDPPDINTVSEELNKKVLINVPTRAQIQPIDYGQDLPEKDLSDRKLRHEVKRSNEYKDNYSHINNVVAGPRKVEQNEQLVGNKQFYHTDADLGYSQDLPSSKQCVTEQKPKESVPVEPFVEQKIDVANVDSGQLGLEQQITESRETTAFEKNKKVEYSTGDNVDPTVVPQSQVPEDVTPSGNYTDDVEYPVDVLNFEHFTPNNDVVLQDGVNVNPEGYGMNQSHFKQFSETVAIPQACTEQQQYRHEKEQQQYGNEQQLYSNEQVQQQYSTEQQLYSNEQAQQQYSNEQVQQQYSNDQQQMQYSTEQQRYEDTLDSNINLQIGDEITVPAAGHDDPSNPTVDEIEAEQTQFYQEPVEGDVTYNEEGANMYETQNENFDQNGQYYYEAPHDQAYPSEINEHEETTQEYDPVYAQQYLNTQGGEYVQQQGNEQSDLQYTQQEGYEPAPVAYDQQYQEQPQAYEQYNQEYYDQQQYQQENYEPVQQIEQQLNSEENYSVVQNEETARSEQVAVEAVNQDQPEQAQNSDVSTIRAN